LDPRAFLAARTRQIEVSGIRKVFELGKSLKDPINLSIGQPHFDVPDPIKQAAKQAIDQGHNAYTVTQGIAEFRERIKKDTSQLGHPDREVIITSGTSGGLLLALLAVVNPGDEVIIPDPYFVAYPHMVTLAGGKSVFVDTYPDFRIDPAKIEAAITGRTKVILLCSPSNPTGATVSVEVQKQLAEIARKHNVLLISDEIYKAFHYDTPARSPAEFDENVLVIEGFGKTYGMTGWRLGFAHGPKVIIDEIMKLQQFTFVCAPSMVQYAGLAALEYDVSGIVRDYQLKRDLLCDGLKDHFEFLTPGGAFYLFVKAPWGTGTEFVSEAVRNSLLVIPGGVFSRQDTHFRISYAAKDETLQRGIEVLNRIAKR
jgi:aspartate/methionine/tyrosine aminotransferase